MNSRSFPAIFNIDGDPLETIVFKYGSYRIGGAWCFGEQMGFFHEFIKCGMPRYSQGTGHRANAAISAYVVVRLIIGEVLEIYGYTFSPDFYFLYCFHIANIGIYFLISKFVHKKAMFINNEHRNLSEHGFIFDNYIPAAQGYKSVCYYIIFVLFELFIGCITNCK